MDDIIVRPRYPRQSVHSLRRRKSIKAVKSTFVEKIIKQVFASVLILAVITVIRAINTPFTNFISSKIQDTLFKNMELNTIYEKIEVAIEKIKGNSSGEEKENEPEDEAVTAIADAYEPDTGDNELNTVFILPVDGKISSAFGERNHPLKNYAEFHKGIDIDAGEDDAIKAALDGEVIETGANRTYGNYVKIKHKNNMTTVYAHCSKIIVKEGQNVKQGDIIAQVGNTGLSVGSHLHFEIWKDGEPVNPLSYIDIPIE
ncbi:MAG TPA: M23 family metallopeptidase [Clostridiaceae bacterium]|nr:M23 family metallopeptidase [Clostridiaceae bacterium]